MSKDRWKLLYKYYDTDLSVLIKELGFDDYKDVLNWILTQFKTLDARSIYGCGPCCNDHVWQFVKAIEENSGINLNNLVIDNFNEMTTSEKKNIVNSYNWFFRYDGVYQRSDKFGEQKIIDLEKSLQHTQFFKVLREEKENLHRISRMQQKLIPFNSRQKNCYEKIKEHEKNIAILKNQIKSIEKSKYREIYLFDFLELPLAEQLKVLSLFKKPIAFYEGALLNLLNENNFNQLPKQTLEKLHKAACKAKSKNLPEVTKLSKIIESILNSN